MHEITDAIKELCAAVDGFPDPNTPIVEMLANGIERGKYDKTSSIRENLGKAVDFLRVLGDEASESLFADVPGSFSNTVLEHIRELSRIAKDLPGKCQPQTTPAVPPSYWGSEGATAQRVDKIFSLLYPRLINIRASLVESQKATRQSAQLSAAEPQKVHVSYAWGDISPNASKEDRERQEVVERLCQALESDHWIVVRDKTELRYGDIISRFMNSFGQADVIIVVLSCKYLRSPYCMTELYAIYQRSLQQKEEFLRRIIPLVLDDAHISDFRDRAEHAKHWQKESETMEQYVQYLGETDLKLYHAMKRWQIEVGDMLAYISDKLAPRGFEEIVKDDFIGLRQMLAPFRSK
jgi:TIR domain